MISLHCPNCAINWYIYQAVKGACPVCGRGTLRTQDPASPEAKERYERARKTKNFKKFEEYYQQREAQSKKDYNVVNEAESVLRRLRENQESL